MMPINAVMPAAIKNMASGTQPKIRYAVILLVFRPVSFSLLMVED